MAMSSQKADDSAFRQESVRQFIIRNLGDEPLIARHVLLAIAKGDASAVDQKTFLKHAFRLTDLVTFFEYLAVFMITTGGRLPEAATIPSTPSIQALFAPLSTWMKQTLIERQSALPPVNEAQGIAFVDAVLVRAEMTLLALKKAKEAEDLSVLRACIDEGWRDYGQTWVLATSFSSHIGHFAYAATLLTLKAAEMLSGPPIVMLRGPSQNPFMLGQFDAHLCDAVPPGVSYVETMTPRKQYRLTGGALAPMSALVSDAATRWSRQQPFLTLDSETKARGDAALAALGVPVDAPVVTLHVRTIGYSQAIGHRMRLRDARIASYGEAVKRLTEQGISVVRLGDRTMERAPDWAGFVDYPFTDAKSDWMDVYLAARCRFHIGTSSGMSFVPLMYGRPVVFTNWPTLDQMVCAPSVITLPKVLLDEAGNVVPFAEYCDKHGHILETSDADLYGLTVLDNAPSEIAEAVDLMVEHFDDALGRPVFPAELFAAAQAVTAASPLGTRPQIPPHFFAQNYGDHIHRGASGEAWE